MAKLNVCATKNFYMLIKFTEKFCITVLNSLFIELNNLHLFLVVVFLA